MIIICKLLRALGKYVKKHVDKYQAEAVQVNFPKKQFPLKIAK